MPEVGEMKLEQLSEEATREHATEILKLIYSDDIQNVDWRRIEQRIVDFVVSIAQASQEDTVKQIKLRGEEDCPHHDEKAEQCNYAKKRECPRCWQELGEK